MNVKKMLEAARYREARGDFKGADELEKMARRAQIDAFVPQNVLEGVHSGVGGDVSGQLGGLHVEMNVTPPSQNQAAKEAAISVLTSGGFLSGEAIAAAASTHGADPQETQAWVEYLHGLTQFSGNDPNLLRQLADQSGNVQMNLATQNPGSNFQSWGITPEDIMWHEKEGHGGKLQSSPDEYLNIANPGADMPRGFGGGIFPQQYWTSVRDQFMAGQGPQEWGPNKRIWEQRVVPKARQRLQQMMPRAAMSDTQDCLDNINACNDMLDDPMLSPKRKKQIKWELNQLIDQMAGTTETPRFVRLRPSMQAIAQRLPDPEIEQCMWCNAVLQDGRWVPHHEKIKTENVTHVMCPNCEGDNDWISELEEMKRTAGWLDSIRSGLQSWGRPKRQQFYDESAILSKGKGTDPNAWRVFGFVMPSGCQTECDSCGKDIGEFQKCMVARTSGRKDAFSREEWDSYETQPVPEDTMFFCSANCLNDRRRFVANRDT